MAASREAREQARSLARHQYKRDVRDALRGALILIVVFVLSLLVPSRFAGIDVTEAVIFFVGGFLVGKRATPSRRRA